jgi:hypothetical protein
MKMWLSDIIEENRKTIENYFHIGFAHWEDMIKKIKNYEGANDNKKMEDEQLWTFLLGCGYAAGKKEGINKLARMLTNDNINTNEVNKIWFEVLPLPPRQNERNTHLDLALGNISLRNGTKSGIQLKDNIEDPWICFCEMKWNSDISTKVSHDLRRNQMIRVIENALTFQNSKYKLAEDIYFTLVTPALFKNEPKSRLYHYKFEDYIDNKDAIYDDIYNCKLDEYDQSTWQYPDEDDLQSQINKLNLNWLTYENLFEKLPKSNINKEILTFWQQYSKEKH